MGSNSIARSNALVMGRFKAQEKDLIVAAAFSEICGVYTISKPPIGQCARPQSWRDLRNWPCAPPDNFPPEGKEGAGPRPHTLGRASD